MDLFHKNKNTPKFSGGGTLTASVKEENGVPNDKCIICGVDTGIAQNTPVDERKRYISGCGQLCRDCYFDLYINPDSCDNTVPNEYEMERLLEMSRKE